MLLTEIFVPGTIPSLKNSKRIVKSKNGGVRIIKSIRAMEFFDTHIPNLSQLNQLNELNLKLVISVRYPDKRRRDLDNTLSTLLDLLVASNILIDDSAKHVSEITVKLVDDGYVGALIQIYRGNKND